MGIMFSYLGVFLAGFVAGGLVCGSDANVRCLLLADELAYFWVRGKPINDYG